jgi:hypothetical protein
MCVKRRRRSSAHPERIGHGTALSEFVEFEIPCFEDATRLCTRLGVDWFSWVQTCDALRLVVVMLVPDADDLAALLRCVEEWGRQSALDAISFEVDGRRYALDTRNRAVTDVAA